MARQKKCYPSIIAGTATHQPRGGGTVPRLNRPHRYATNPVETPVSPTWTAARAAKKLPVHTHPVRQRPKSPAKPA